MSKPRTYGGWRPRKGFGVGFLTELQTAVLAGCIGMPLALWIATTSFGLPMVIMPIAVGVAALTAALTLIPNRTHGTSLAGALALFLRTATARRHRWMDWEREVFTRHPRGRELPGVLAPLMPLSTQDGLGQPYGLLWCRRTGRMTAAIELAPVGLALADQDRADAWIGNWAAWKAALGYEPMVEWISVVVESAPSAATTISDYLTTNLAPDAPTIARETLLEVADAHRGTTAEISVRLNLHLQPNRARPQPRTDADRVAEVSRVCGALEADLPLCGVASLGRASAAHFALWLRGAYDPASRSELPRLREEEHLLAWREAGPVTARTHYDHYWHDSGWSVSWALEALPNQLVTSTILAPLTAPGRYHRRVSVNYQAFPADAAADAVGREAAGTTFRRRLRRRRGLDDTARHRLDEARANQAADEEAHGAGVGLWTLYVTTTVTDPDHLPDAVADVESRARAAKLQLRRCWGWQHVGFAASLGLIYPSELRRRDRRAR
ncbi:hypothetical protein GCM10022247_34950 [Allokutzneria multivorans]|uniref:PrgI family protein n=1 Tax=Allokutzneria multivorans TaxID=1142134 RepID=A0ABP7SC55_9PSEU